jgi:membrane-bound lytic murein transglycosylase D
MNSRTVLTTFVVPFMIAACGQPLRSASVAPAPVSAPSTVKVESPGEVAVPRPKDGPFAIPVVPTDSVANLIEESIATASAVFGVSEAQLASVTKLVPGIDSVEEESSEEGPASWDLDVASYVTNERVSHYVDLFTGSAKARIASRMQRGRHYEPMIRAKFRAAGIPEDMYFLGLVESGYDPHAYSRAAAVGMWQFMTTTARGVGMRVDWWVDERRDPARSTDAAARFLTSLNKQFGSYYLAAAAYNGGPGRVSRGLSRFADEIEESEGDDRFFALASQNYLRPETRNYVPQLIAAALIGKEPAKYGIEFQEIAEFAYDSVIVPPMTPLSAVAKASAAGLATVRELNGQYIRGVTPPDRASWVKVPTGMHEGFLAKFSALPDEDRLGFTRATTKKGQSLAAFAASHGVTAENLRTYNRKISYASKTRLVAGQVMLIPGPEVLAGARDVPDPAVERYGATTTRGRTVHLVKRGESLGLIAKRYKTSVSTIVRLNGLKRQVIYPGQSIIVRGTAARRATTRRGG